MKYNISDVIDFNIISVFQYYSTVSFIISVIMEIFYALIDFLTTTKKMQFFRILTFLYIFECIFAEFIMYCWKPIRLVGYMIIYNGYEENIFDRQKKLEKNVIFPHNFIFKFFYDFF